MKRKTSKLSRTVKSNGKEINEHMDKERVTSNVKTNEVIPVGKEGSSVKPLASITPGIYADAVKKGRWIGEPIQPSTSGYVNAPMRESRTKNQGGTLEDAVRGERKNEGETDIYYSDTVTSDPSKTGGKPSYAGAVKGKYSMNVCVLVCA